MGDAYIVTQDGIMVIEDVLMADAQQIFGYTEGQPIMLTRFGMRPDDTVTVYYHNEDGYVQYRGNNLNTIVVTDEEEAKRKFSELIQIVTLVKACKKVKEDRI